MQIDYLMFSAKHGLPPPSSRVPAEMKRFVFWFGRTATGRDEPLPTLTRAGIAHLYFESIQPFEDGNGRIGRAIAEKALAKARQFVLTPFPSEKTLDA